MSSGKGDLAEQEQQSRQLRLKAEGFPSPRGGKALGREPWAGAPGGSYQVTRAGRGGLGSSVMAVTVFRGRGAGPHLGDSHISGTDAELKEDFSKGHLPSRRLLHWIAPGPEIPTLDTPLNEVTGGPGTGGYVTWWVTHHHLERANRPRVSRRPKGKLGESVKWGLGESEAV